MTEVADGAGRLNELQVLLRRYRTFLEVVDRTGFGKAARTLGVNQSAVSQQISRLEDALGRKLFRRAASGVTLTADGETFLFYARPMAALTEDVRRHFAQDAGTGLLVVGSCSAGRRCLAFFGCWRRRIPA